MIRQDSRGIVLEADGVETKLMEKSDFIGRVGEAIAFMRLGKLCRVDSDSPYFIPHSLDGKARTFDHLVELVDADESPRFFFVQVKSTRKDFTKNQDPPRLRIEVSERDVRRMVACPVPTYVVGVHEPTDRAFLIAVHGEMSEAISSMTTAHELGPDSLEKLWNEVRAFWQDRDMTQKTSFFKN
jgi:hypothetical protein